jgi:hypothetical protein
MGLGSSWLGWLSSGIYGFSHWHWYPHTYIVYIDIFVYSSLDLLPREIALVSCYCVVGIYLSSIFRTGEISIQWQSQPWVR